MGMPVHWVEWVAHAGGVTDVDLVCESLVWLTGSEECIDVERMDSYHGSNLYLIRALLQKKSEARLAFARLGVDVLSKLGDSLDGRVDDDNCLHLRLSLNSLASGEIELVEPTTEQASIKGKVKLEAYPGEDSIEVASTLIEQAIERAVRNDLPEPP
tara:strand:+ start:1164 stop:1634 length:471 start_codon:yes stop_codon:yes gene_type:complete